MPDKRLPERRVMGTARFGLLLVAGLLTASPVVATPLPRQGLLVFSSLCTDRMTSDLNGDRLVFVRLPLHDFGFMEGGDGRFVSAPLQDLRIDDRTGRISFRYHDNESNDPNAFKSVTSTITAESVGLTSRDGKSFRLTRLYRPGGKFPVCRDR